MANRISSAVLEASTAALAALAFGISPLIQYAPPISLALAAFSFASVVFFIVMNLRTAEPARSYLLPAIGLLIAAGSLGVVVRDAATDYRLNVRRCAVLQNDMLSGRPRRSDSSTLFQALGCKPHGDGGVHAPPRDVLAEVLGEE